MYLHNHGRAVIQALNKLDGSKCGPMRPHNLTPRPLHVKYYIISQFRIGHSFLTGVVD